MAPVAPLGRARACKLVAAGRFPIAFGSPHPRVVILQQDGAYRIRGLVVDPGEAREASVTAIARDEAWMPEHYYALGKPTGTIYAEARTPNELLAQMKTMEWPADW